MLLTIKQYENRTQMLHIAAEQSEMNAAVAVFLEGHFSIERHLQNGGSPAEGAGRALEMYLKRGMDALCEVISGEFALVILDGTKLTLVTDILDNVPLYWGEAPLPRGGRVVCVGTNLAAVAEQLALAGRRRCVPDKLFLTAHLVSATHLLLHTLRTPLEGIQRVPGGHYVKLDLEYGTRMITRYWDPAAISPMQIDVPAAIERLDSILEGVVRECFAYGPVGISVSGGLDSGSVAAYASRIAPKQTHCLTLGSERWRTIPEEKFAQQNVESMGLELHVVNVDEIIPFRQFEPKTIYTYGLPVNILAEYHHLLADTAQSLGAVTMLDGDGGDEFFGVGHAPVYLLDLLRAGWVGCALRHLRSWHKFQAVSPLNILYQTWRRPHEPLPRLRPWLRRARETAALFANPAGHAPPQLAGRVRANYVRMNLTENWWSSGAVYGPRNMKLLHPLRAREIAELTYAVPQWILQNPAEYKWLLRKTVRMHFPRTPFEPVNNDYSHLITHGVRLAKDRLMSYFTDNCRLVAHGITTEEICDFVRMYLRDPAGSEHWAPDGEEVVGQTALFAEMWLRGYEEVYGK